MNNALIIGASSGVGRALAEILAESGWNLVLSSRSERDLEAVSADLIIRYGINSQVLTADINETAGRDKLLLSILKGGKINYLFITIGDVIENDNGLQDHIVRDRLVKTNFLSIMNFLSDLLQSFDKNEKLKIALCSSIAVGRPRKNNLVYATSKSAIDFYCRGIQHLFANTTIRMFIFRLGYIDTSMSYGKKLMFTPVSPINAAKNIASKLNERRLNHYYPWFWRYITLVIQSIPWKIYKNLTF